MLIIWALSSSVRFLWIKLDLLGIASRTKNQSKSRKFPGMVPVKHKPHFETWEDFLWIFVHQSGFEAPEFASQVKHILFLTFSFQPFSTKKIYMVIQSSVFKSLLPNTYYIFNHGRGIDEINIIRSVIIVQQCSQNVDLNPKNLYYD